MCPPLRFSNIAAFILLLGNVLNSAAAADDDPIGREDQTVTAPGTGTLVVRVEGVKSGDGNLRLVLFDSKKNFLKRPVRADVIEIDGLRGTWTVEQLPYGTYAVLAHHDIDASGKMERHWYGKPKEPTGASNDAPARFGPPKFKDAKFALDSPELTITITIE